MANEELTEGLLQYICSANLQLLDLTNEGTGSGKMYVGGRTLYSYILVVGRYAIGMKPTNSDKITSNIKKKITEALLDTPTSMFAISVDIPYDKLEDKDVVEVVSAALPRCLPEIRDYVLTEVIKKKGNTSK